MVFAVLVGAGLALAVIVYLYALVSDPLRDVPGPLLARFTRLWELQRVRGNHFEQVNWELHAKYGPIVRLAPGRYSINDRTALKQVFGHASKFPKAPFYHAFGHPDPLQADMFSELDINRHGAKRRKVASLYSMTALLSYEQFVDRCNATLCSRLRGFADRPLHVPSWRQYYAFDVIGEITVGEPFGMMDRPECPDPRGILQAIHDSMVYGSRMGLFSELHPWLGRVTSAFGIKIPFDTVMSLIREQIAKRRADKTSAHRADFLDKLLRMQEDNKVSELDIITTIGANIAAGSDTTAISLSSIVYNLLTHPEYARKLQAELDDLSSTGQMGDPVTFQQAQQMPYLQAVIKEALRVHPAVGQPLSRIVPPGGAEIAGRYFPAGSSIGVNPWVLHRNPDVFGDDADAFRPERWLDEDREKVLSMDQAIFTVRARALP
ncbi:hypothetical protein LTR53_016571 [Teratosphaeriaceae sp. CCFEE 6253]|nr:hypothetical protein LTR53_016571 [Teratosphaeriaceae sp. CCFEE 6253]